jgi:hypothetical protein
MKNTNFYIAIIAALIVISLNSFRSADTDGGSAIYVAPNGNDANVGSIAQPLKTLSAALDKSRKGNVKNIILRGGQYYNVSIVFLPQDSNLTIKNYSNETPVLYGGMMCDNLTKQGKYFVANVPGASDRTWDFRMILKNNQILYPARFPNKGLFTYKNKWNQKTLAATAGVWQRKPTSSDLDGLRYDDNDFKSIDPHNAEIVLQHSWNESYVGVKNIDSINDVIYFSNPSTYPLGAYLDQTPNANKYVIYNVVQGMTKGSWYLNRSEGKLYYWPLSSDNINTTHLYLPKYPTVFNFGTNNVKNITVEGVEIIGCSNRIENENFAAVSIDAAIRGTNVSKITLKNIKIMNSGGSGINLTGNNNLLNNVSLLNLYGGGVYINGKNNVLSNLSLKNIGLFFKSAVGIYEDGADNNILSTVIDSVSYSGISIRGTGSAVNGCKISNVMQNLNDGSAIYCAMHDSITIENNTLIGHANSKIGIYFDEKSNNSTASGNTIVDFLMPVHCHIATNIKVNGNVIFSDLPNQSLSYQNSKNVQFADNIIIGNDIYLDSHHADVANTGLALVQNNYFVTATQVTASSPNSVLSSSFNNLKGNNHFIPLSNNQIKGLFNKNMPGGYSQVKSALLSKYQ